MVIHRYYHDEARYRVDREKDKRHVLYDGGHDNLITRLDVVKEALDWLDRYLGPVKERR